MTEQQQKSTLNKTRLAVFVSIIIVFTALSVAAVIYAVTSSGTPEMLSKEDISANLESMSGEDKGYSTVSKYLSDYGIGGYDSFKLRTVEAYYKQYTAFTPLEPMVHAKKTAELYLEYFYDITDSKDEAAVTDALLACYIRATDDKYAVYRTKEEFEIYDTDMSGSFVGIGVTVQYNETEGTITVISVHDDSAAEKAGVLIGDIIFAVDGKKVSEIGYQDAVNSIRGEIGTNVTVTVKRGEELHDLVCTRAQITEYTVKYELDTDGIGYVQLTGFKDNTAEQFKEAIDFLTKNNCEGIIFDLRNNPGGYLASVIDVIDYLVPDRTRIVSYKYASESEQVYYSDDGHNISVPVVVICNGNTASAGELFTAAIRDYDDMGILDATIVGERTYAKGVMQNTFMLSDKSTITLTVAYYNPPSNINYDGVGVEPDTEVEITESGVDSQLGMAYIELYKLIN